MALDAARHPARRDDGHHASVTSASPPQRLGYLDWLRGITVLVMIEAHTFDSWTMLSERTRPWFGRLMVLGGMAAPLFLFLAGVAISLSAASQIRRSAAPSLAAHRVELRGWQLFRYAFLFRLQSFVLSGFRSPRSLLKVDILNVMGPAIALTARLWGVGRSRWSRAAWLTFATVAVVLVTPWIRTTPLLDQLPDPLERYIRPPAGQGTFTLFPWAAFVPAGARTRSGDRRRRLVRLVASGAASGWRPCDRPRARRARRVGGGATRHLPCDLLDDVARLLHAARRTPAPARRRGVGVVCPAVGSARRAAVRSRHSAWGRFSSTGCTSSWSTASPQSRSAMP